MIIVVKPDSTDAQIDHIVETIEGMGLKTDVSRGVKRTLIGVIGEEDLVRNAPLRAIPGVEEVVPILKPYKLASREYQKEDSCFDVGLGVLVGGGHLAMIAGPCAIEGEDVLLEIGKAVKAAGANILRGGPTSRERVRTASRVWGKTACASCERSGTNWACRS